MKKSLAVMLYERGSESLKSFAKFIGFHHAVFLKLD